jgi:hypothetical protein
MAYPKITTVMESEAITAPGTDFTTDAVISQAGGEECLFYLEFTSNPGTLTGKVYLEGRLSEDASWAEVWENGGSTRIELDLTNVIPPNYNIMASGVPLLHAQRWASDTLANSNTTTAHAFLIE